MSLFLIFTAIVLLIFGLANVYIYKRLIKKISLFKYFYKAFIPLLALLFIAQVVFLFLGRSEFFNEQIYWALSMSFAPTYCFFFLTLLIDIIRLVLKIARKNYNLNLISKISLEFVIIALGGLFTYYAITNALNTPQINEVNLKIKNLKNPLKIALLTDIHLGKNLHEDFLNEIITQTNAQKPDIVMIGGDLVDTDVKDLAYISKLNLLKSKYGSFFVPGNHEYYHGIYEVLELLSENTNLQILLNKTMEFDDFIVGGVGDLAGFRIGVFGPDFAGVRANLKEDKASILLTHQPKSVSLFDEARAFDLILSGHTHGGQVFPFMFAVMFNQGFVSGLYDLGDSKLFVSRGAGFWGPSLRTFAKSEIVILNLQGELDE